MTEKIQGITTGANSFFAGLKINFGLSVIFDILIVVIIFYYVYIFLRETRAIRILYGFVILILAMFLAKIFNLILLNFILKYLTTALVVAIPIVFQPELRAALEKIGRPRFWADINLSRDELDRMIDEVCVAVRSFSGQKIGALIIIQRRSGLKEYIDNGILVESKVSADILSSIFFPKSPLHDGAAIIVGRKIASASSILPVAEIEASKNLGTRHRAAIGVTQLSDAIAIVVSEETGTVSIAVGGNIERRISEEKLKIKLSRLLRVNVKENQNLFQRYFSRKKAINPKK